MAEEHLNLFEFAHPRTDKASCTCGEDRVGRYREHRRPTAIASARPSFSTIRSPATDCLVYRPEHSCSASIHGRPSTPGRASTPRLGTPCLSRLRASRRLAPFARFFPSLPSLIWFFGRLVRLRGLLHPPYGVVSLACSQARLAHAPARACEIVARSRGFENLESLV